MGRKLAVFDTETSGVDVYSDRIVTAFIGIMDEDGTIDEEWSWFLNPEVEIPEGASAIHGISTERARAEGTDAKEGVFKIAQRLDIISRQGIPVVVYNATFDLTLLKSEVERHYPGMRFTAPDVVIDPLVLDKQLDQFRRGSRKLVDVAAHYGVKVSENAHDAREDCIMAGALAFRIIGRFGEHPSALSEKSVGWKRRQAAGMQAHFRKKDPTAKVNGGFPFYEEEQDE